MPEVTRKCHPFGKLRTSAEAKPKDLANEKEIPYFAARSLSSSEAKDSE